MVNEKYSNRKKILEILRNAHSPLSGESISRELGISRVAVWKQIQNLNELGYKIGSSPSGYLLKEQKDHLYPWEFSKEKSNYTAFRELDSTMDRAREMALKDCPDFTTVLAEKQILGRGRGTRQWDSEEGGLYFTWIIRPELPLAYHYIYTFGAAAALAETVKEMSGIELRTKWPNDLISEKGKVAGFLTEMETSGDSVKWLNLGIGINVNNKTEIPGRVSLRELYGNSFNRRELFEIFEKRFRLVIQNDSPEEIRDYWKRSCMTLGKTVRLTPRIGETISGKAVSIDAAGSLLIKDINNRERQALFGETYEKKE